ncbi:MAG TPA: CAP domain-containing protein [Acidimicrobiia bacterium]|jgi:hypothetical protein
MRSNTLRTVRVALIAATVTSAAGIATLTPAVTATAAPAVHQAATSRAASPSATPQGPFTVTMSNREDVRQFFYRVHEASNDVAPGWTGSIAGCNPGTVSSDYLNATLTRINYFRAMAGVPSNVTLNATDNQQAQAAALMMSAQNDLSHAPPNTWACWSQDGFDGASSSNLALGNTGPASIDQLMFDDDVLGHRRNMLYEGTDVMGSGSVPATSGHDAAEAQYVLSPPVSPVPTPRDGFMAWPPKGFVPYQIVYPRWSFSLANASFAGATVTMSSNGNNVPVTIEGRDNEFGDPAIIWIPTVNGVTDGQAWPNPGADATYTVTVSGVTVNGNPVAPSTYNVTVIDPSKGDSAHAPSGPASPPVGQNSQYSVPAIPNATGYQWRTTPLSASTLNDGAENGLSNWTANVDGYTPIETTNVASGSHAFDLYIGQFNNPDTLTLNSTLLPNASSQLSFDSETADFDHLDASVQVSTDGGTTWSSAPFQQAGGNETSFTHKTVSLAPYAGEQINIRFSVAYAFDGGGVCLCNSNVWYFDNVALSNTQQVGTPTLSGVTASPSFNFDPSTAGPYAIDVRPEYSNPTAAGVFSQASIVTATSGGLCSGCPGAPTVAFVNSGSGWVTVGWTPPSSSGTSAISSYVVTTSPGGQTVTVPAGASRAVVSVPNGTAQRATVAAVNASGSGPKSSPSASFTPKAASVSVKTSYNAADNTRLLKDATYYGQTAVNAQKTSVGVLAYLVGLVGSSTTSPITPPVSSGTHSYTTSYSTSDQGALVTVMRQYGLSPSEAQYLSVYLVGYLLSLNGH